MGKRSHRAMQLGFAVVVGIGLLELIFRWRDHGAFPHLNTYQSDPVLGVRLRPLAKTRIAFGGSQLAVAATDSAGFRSAEPSSEPPPRDGEVLFVGDSQTFGLGVDFTQTFVSRFGELTKRPVYNAGVPTWGPPEYATTIDTVAKRRHPRTIVYVVNFANDAFEANHSNLQRHVAWDGWAVRREFAPKRVTGFPGREWLFRSSHLVFAWRKWLHSFGGPKLDERGTPSEGTFRDLVDLGQSEEKQLRAARIETERRVAQYESENTYAEELYRNAESRVRALVWSALKLGANAGGDPTQSPGSVYLAADANPGDIVTPGYGEEGRPIYATAQYIRQAVALRNKFESELRERAQKAIDSAEAKQILDAIAARDAERIKIDLVRNRPLDLARHTSPLLRAVLEAKRQTDKLGAELVLLVLPLDVMVSDTEWPKHGSKRVDLSATNVLIDDLVEGARAASITTVDATPILRQNEPGAFLPGDIHLTPKGHLAVAAALVQAMGERPRPVANPNARLQLKSGRSRVPPPETWRALAGEIAVMNSGRCPVTKKYREWLYIHCYPNTDRDPTGIGIRVTAGGQGDAIASVFDGHMTFVAPIPKGERLEALFTWSDGLTKRLIGDWDPMNAAPDLRMEIDKTQKADPPPHPEVVRSLCACQKSERKTDNCQTLIAEPDSDCARSYAGKCGEMLACAEGNPLYPPNCEPGTVHRGATSRCVTDSPTEHVPANQSTDEGFHPASLQAASEDSPNLPPLGRKVILAAQAFVGNGCRLAADQVELISVIPFDRCPIDAAMVSGYSAALEEFERQTTGGKLTAPGTTFVEKARWFGKWVKVALASRDTRGASALYQDLALAYNAWQPKNGVFVDSPRLIDLFFGLSGLPQNDYFRNLHHDGAKRKQEFLASGRHFVWRRGPNGFEGPFLSLNERIVAGY